SLFVRSVGNRPNGSGGAVSDPAAVSFGRWNCGLPLKVDRIRVPARAIALEAFELLLVAGAAKIGGELFELTPLLLQFPALFVEPAQLPLAIFVEGGIAAPRIAAARGRAGAATVPVALHLS